MTAQYDPRFTPVHGPYTCQEHPERAAVAPEGETHPFLCEDCAECCVYCNEMSQPDQCARDDDERCTASQPTRASRRNDDDIPEDSPSLEDHPMYYHVHNRNPYGMEGGY